MRLSENFTVRSQKILKKKYEEVSKSGLMAVEVVDEKCEKCGKPMAVKFSRFGKFLACSGFPECRNTKNMKSEVKKSGLNVRNARRVKLLSAVFQRGGRVEKYSGDAGVIRNAIMLFGRTL